MAILEVFKEDGSDFETELAANMQKKGASEGDKGWLVLDMEAVISEQAIIAK